MEEKEKEGFEIPNSENPEIPKNENPESDDEQTESEIDVEVDDEIEPTEKTDAETLTDISDQLAEMLEKFDKTQEAITEFETDSGPIKVIHDVTLGDLLISTLLVAILIFNVFTQLIRRF